MSKDIDCKWSSHEGRAFVDLGLSEMWVACNIDATALEEYGNYYAWGKISTKSVIP